MNNRSPGRQPFRLLAVLLLALASFGMSGHPRPVGPGTTAPDFRLPDLSGHKVRLEDNRGRPVLIHFWASWCKPCREEMPQIEGVYKDLQDTGLVVLGINAGDDLGQAQNFANRHGLSFPTLLDRDWITATAYGVTGLPITFFVDRNGVIVDEVMGGTLTRSTLTERLRKLGMVGS